MPVDGIITQGNAAIDESMMTGESIQMHKRNRRFSDRRHHTYGRKYTNESHSHR
ncbi:MAG: hypothetical protein IPF62_06965 [Bacteroidetes bacterium]|nr:hypothetical protein [Bacteroidota bacterium]